MTLVIANIFLMTLIVVAIVGMLSWAIRSSRTELEIHPVRRRRTARQHAASARAYGSYEGLNA